jgi:hypothetical protein
MPYSLSPCDTGNPNPPRPPSGGTGFGVSVLDAVSVTAADIPFEPDIERFLATATSWTIVLDEGVANFDVSGTWNNSSTLTILGAIVDTQGLCLTVDTQNTRFTISNCE